MSTAVHQSNPASSHVSWKRSLLAMSLAVLSSSLISQVAAAPAAAPGASFFNSPTKSTVWRLGETVDIRFHKPITKNQSENMMLYLEYSTGLCSGSVPDAERKCDNRATKISSFGQVKAHANKFKWTIPTTLDLQLSNGKFQIYDYNGHTSYPFTIAPAKRS
ncbi:hypothetical protein BGZ46_004266 [Entomortierella lignicola]|nr:hypothetical protein BGZ46_004266 [Entomortierella lignicola]